MTVLFGHPTGNPNSHQAALAHLQAGRLEALCVPWLPSETALRVLNSLPGIAPMARRLARRRFEPLVAAPLVQGRAGEFVRLVQRALGMGDERLSYRANDWLMEAMTRECARPAVTAVHSYEDCSLLQFREAKRRGKACIYDMPIGYYPAWEQTEAELVRRYADWLPEGGLLSRSYIRPQQKRDEMEMADLVLAPSEFVADTIRAFYPAKTVKLAPYGVEEGTWAAADRRLHEGMLTFLFVGQCSLRKGIPLLFDAWRAADLADAQLRLVGTWQLRAGLERKLPARVSWSGAVPRDSLKAEYGNADVFVFPSYFEGRALVIGEAMASSLPVLTTRASGADDMIDATCGRIVASGDMDALAEALVWFDRHRSELPSMGRAARLRAAACTWNNYRDRVSDAVGPYVR